MPAIRSRTDHWRDSIRQIYERNGAIEITLPRLFANGDPSGAENQRGQNLIWRVRIVGLSDNEILVEQPSALGHTIKLEDEIALVAIMAIGQNRWMFHTKNIGRTPVRLNDKREVLALRLSMPDKVERCQRRSFYRISTAGLILPKVQCWPVLDPQTIVVAETASQTRIQMFEESAIVASLVNSDEQLVTPEVGPCREARLVNVGGGGAGLIFTPEESVGLDDHRLWWLAINLEPFVPAPLGVTTRLAHTHIDSEQRTYAGMSFEFSHNPLHRKFVADRICRYVNLVQREQLKRRAEQA